jgi:hypothetical protein
MRIEPRWNDIDGENRRTRSKTCPTPLCPLQISYELTRACAVRRLSHGTVFLAPLHTILCHTTPVFGTSLLNDLLNSASVIKIVRERRGQVVTTLSSHWGGPGFLFRPGYQLPWLGFFVFFSVPPDKFLDAVNLATSASIHILFSLFFITSYSLTLHNLSY